MATYKINPAAINPKWGGVLCLTLGSKKPDNFEEIYDKLIEHVKGEKQYTITIYDKDWKIYYGTPDIFEVSYTGSGSVLLRITRVQNLSGTYLTLDYYFNKDKTYQKHFTEKNLFSSLQSQIDELKQKLNEITQTE